MTDLLTHLKTENDKTLAWVAEDPSNRWAVTYTEDLEHWASLGVTTVEDLELYEFQCNYSDMYKYVYGFRPRNDTSAWTREDWKSELEFLSREMVRVEQEERNEEARADAAFKEEIREYIAAGAGDYDTALRWMMQNETFYNEQCLEGFLYSYGILFTDYGKEVLEDMKRLVKYENE